MKKKFLPSSPVQWALVVGLFLLAGFFLVPAIAGRKLDPHRIASGHYQTAVEAVRQQLKSPSTAKLVREDRALEIKGEKVVYRVTMDAQNGFGAMIRGTWLVHGHLDLSAESVSINQVVQTR